jgi:hypothetical protein
MSLGQAILLCLSLFAFRLPIYAMTVKPELSDCETFLDTGGPNSSEPTSISNSAPPIEQVRNFINMTALKTYKPVPLIFQTTLGVIAYGAPDPSFLQNLPNFIACDFQTCVVEFDELRAENIERMIGQSRPNWREEKIWFFEITEPISLLKHGATLPTRFDADYWLIMKEGFPIGRAFLGEVDNIEWF